MSGFPGTCARDVHTDDLSPCTPSTPFITRAVESESLKKSKSLKKSDKVGKVGFDFLLDFWQKKYLINGDVPNAESVGSAQSHNNCFQTNYNLKMLITPERKVSQRSDAFTLKSRI